MGAPTPTILYVVRTVTAYLSKPLLNSSELEKKREGKRRKKNRVLDIISL
jgi:hypothetical protein